MSGFFQLEIAEEDKDKTAFRDVDRLLWEANRAGIDLKYLPSAFANHVGLTLGNLKRQGVENWLDNIYISSKTFDEHTTLISAVRTHLRDNGFSINFNNSKSCHPAQEFIGMVINHCILHPAESKIAAIAKLTPPGTVAELRACLGMTWYLRKFLEGSSTVTAPLTDPLKSHAFQSNRARKMRILWEPKH